MSEYKHLKDRSYYEDLYDSITVRHCRSMEDLVIKREYKNEQEKDSFRRLMNFDLFFQKGERALKRDKTVDEWMQEDRKLDQHFDNAKTPQNVICKFCDKPMILFDKSFRTGIGKSPNRVQFIFHCNPCKVGRLIYDTGEIKEFIPWKCPNCGRKLQDLGKEEGSMIYVHMKCDFCRYEDKHTVDLSEKVEEEIEEESSAEELLQYKLDKDRFCLSEKGKTDFINGKKSLYNLVNLLREIDEETKKKKEAMVFNKVPCAQIQRKITDLIESHGFINLKFHKPETTKDTIVRFEVLDTQKRNHYASRYDLEIFFKDIFKDTNWRVEKGTMKSKQRVISGKIIGYAEKDDCYDADLDPYTINGVKL